MEKDLFLFGHREMAEEKVMIVTVMDTQTQYTHFLSVLPQRAEMFLGIVKVVFLL